MDWRASRYCIRESVNGLHIVDDRGIAIDRGVKIEARKCRGKFLSTVHLNPWVEGIRPGFVHAKTRAAMDTTKDSLPFHHFTISILQVHVIR